MLKTKCGLILFNKAMMIRAAKISKCHVNSANRCIVDNMRADLYAVYSILILQRIGMGTMMTVNGVASHAFHSPRKSNRVVDAENLFPNAGDTLKISIRPLPVCLLREK